MHNSRSFILLCILLAFLIQVFALTLGFCQTTGQAALVEEAKKEGQLLWYVSIVIGDANALVNRFHQKYPFIRTELLRTSSEQQLSKYSKELREIYGP